jgi:hypothetical protein
VTITLTAIVTTIHATLDRFVERQKELERQREAERRQEVEREMFEQQANAKTPADAAHARRLEHASEEARAAIEPSLIEVWGEIETIGKDEFKLSGDGAAWRELSALEMWLMQAREAALQSSADAEWLGFTVDQARAIVDRLRLRRTRDLITALRRVYEEGTPELRITFQDNAEALITADDPAAQEFLDKLARDRLERMDGSPGIMQAQTEREALARTLLDAYRQTRRAVSLLGSDTLTRRSYLGNVLKGIQIECHSMDRDRATLIFSRRTFGGSWFGGKGAPVEPVPAPIDVAADLVRAGGQVPGIIYRGGPGR